MLIRSLLYISPYGGMLKGYKTYYRRAKDCKSIFTGGVKIPKVAMPYQVLPQDLLDYFYKVFEKNKRGIFPDNLLDLQWKKCKHCGLEYSDVRCPCDQSPKGIVVETVTIYNKCKATIIFKTNGVILASKIVKDHLRYVYDENGIKDNNQKSIKAEVDYKFDFLGRNIVYGQKNLLVCNKEMFVDDIRNTPLFGCTTKNIYFIWENMLLRSDYDGNHTMIGEVVPKRTWIKCGKNMGFGFYRLSENTTKYFIFNDNDVGLNYIDLPNIKKKLLDFEVYFSNNNMLIMFTVVEGKIKVNHAHLYNYKDGLVCSMNSKKTDSDFLKYLHGKTLHDNKVMTPTDQGLLLSVINQDGITDKLFSDTEPFVDYYSELHTSPKGIYVVSDNDIKLLEMQ